MGASPFFEVLVGGRFVAGMGIGIASSTVPVYISECASAKRRGFLSTFPQLMVSTGILTSYAVVLLLLLSNASWRYMLACSLPLAFCQVLLAYTLPETPRWLLRSASLSRGALAQLVQSASPLPSVLCPLPSALLSPPLPSLLSPLSAFPSSRLSFPPPTFSPLPLSSTTMYIGTQFILSTFLVSAAMARRRQHAALSSACAPTSVAITTLQAIQIQDGPCMARRLGGRMLVEGGKARAGQQGWSSWVGVVTKWRRSSSRLQVG